MAARLRPTPASLPSDHMMMLGVMGVAAHHPGDAVDQHLGPVRVVGRVADPALAVLETVRLQVVLVDHVEPVPVAQIQEVRVRRVVARADGVDVVPLHEQHVLEHPLGRHGTAAQRVELVPVDAAQLDRPPVDEEHAVLDRDRAEADRERHRLGVGRDDDVVEPRPFGAPRLDVEPQLLARCPLGAELRDRHACRDGDRAPPPRSRRRPAACRRRSCGRSRRARGRRRARRPGGAPA